MQKIVCHVSRISKLWVNGIIVSIYAVLLMLYQNSIEGLEKPAGLGEAFVFLFKYPSEYVAALIIGIILHTLFLAMFVIVVLSLLGIWSGKLKFEIPIGINIVLCVMMGILNMHYAQYVISLLLAIFVVLGIVCLVAQSNR